MVHIRVLKDIGGRRGEGQEMYLWTNGQSKSTMLVLKTQKGAKDPRKREGDRFSRSSREPSWNIN